METDISAGESQKGGSQRLMPWLLRLCRQEEPEAVGAKFLPTPYGEGLELSGRSPVTLHGLGFN